MKHRNNKELWVVIIFILMLTVFSGSGNQCSADNREALLPKNAEWQYLDNGGDLGGSWRAAGYNDSAWKKGKAPLGFGDDYSETDPALALATQVEFGDPLHKPMTTYFRTQFDVDQIRRYKALEVYIHVDDGAVVYINGREAFRRGIAPGVAVNFNTSAKFKPKEETFQLPATVLQDGKNTVAVEVHQDSEDSSDLWFEMSLRGVTDQPAVVQNEVTKPLNTNSNLPRGNVSKVVVTFHGDPATAKGFVWYTNPGSVNSNLQVIEDSGSTPDFRNAMTFSGRCAIATHSPAELVHKAEATGLKPDTSYCFRVGDAALDLWSDCGSFRTASKRACASSRLPFTFIDLADTQAKSEDEALLSAETIATALDTVKMARFLVFNGDVVDKGMNEQQWNWLLGAAQKSLLHTTFVPCAGNHDADPHCFMEHFNVAAAPGSPTVTGAYYSYDYCNAHFIILNNNEDSPEYADFTPAQIEWLKKDAQAAKTAGAEWLIVIMHKGPYTTSNHATDREMTAPNGMRANMAPLFTRLGIDLVLQGHDHIYARTKPLQDGKAIAVTKMMTTLKGKTIEYAVRPEGTVYLIPNTAGPKVYYRNQKIDPSFYNLFEVADESHAAVYGPDPADPRRPMRGRIQNFVGITIHGNKLTAVTYEMDRSKNNGQPYIIDQFGILKKANAVASRQRGDGLPKVANQ